jgi:putative ABC transport system ATP-binding protein
MIKTVNLTKIFRTEMVETTALFNISFNAGKGEFVAIMGPSGCGKSTLLNILGLLDGSDSGEYYFDGVEVSGFSENQRTKLRKGNIGFIFQSFNLIDELTVYENVELPLIALNVAASERKARVGKILDYMKIGHRRDHFPRQLSGGQQQRAAIARALVTDPKLILADEPTGNLDSTNGEQVMQLLEEMNARGTTIIMVTHSVSHAERAHRIVNLFDGQLVMERSERIFQPINSNFINLSNDTSVDLSVIKEDK